MKIQVIITSWYLYFRHKFKLVMICINSRIFDLRNTIKKAIFPEKFSAPQAIGKENIGNEGFIGINEKQGKSGKKKYIELC